MLRWGLIAPGGIAGKFADALTALPDHRLTRVAGRDFGRAQAFAARFGAQAVTDPAQMCAMDDVDIVYVASPHSAHAEQARLALAAGKPVLCEKSLTPDRASSQALCEDFRARGLFLMEAVWSRFQPGWRRVVDLLRAGAIGRVQRIHSSFCMRPAYDPHSRLFDPLLAGGALLDIGIYNLSLSQFAMQAAGQGGVTRFAIDGELAPTGVEQRVEGALFFDGGARAVFVCRLDGCSDNQMLIEGDAGWIRLHTGFWHAQQLSWQAAGGTRQDEAHPFLRNGMEYEAQACAEALRQGWLEHPLMPHADTLATLGLIDAMRAQLGAR